MKTKTMTALLALIVFAVFVTPASAAWLDDEWFIDKAITEVETDHTELDELDVVWNGAVTSSFELQWRPYVPLHKHASLVGSYGFASSGYVQWDGRVYVAPWYGVHELNYILVKPRSPELSTDVVNPKYKYFWDGKKWVENTPIITVVDGRTRVVYPIPD